MEAVLSGRLSPSVLQLPPTGATPSSSPSPSHTSDNTGVFVYLLFLFCCVVYVKVFCPGCGDVRNNSKCIMFAAVPDWFADFDKQKAEKDAILKLKVLDHSPCVALLCMYYIRCLRKSSVLNRRERRG